MEVLRQAIEVSKANAKRAEAWVYDEHITHWTISPEGRRKRGNRMDYEVMALEGKPYFKLVRLNGKALKGKDREAEERRMERAARERREKLAPNAERRRLGIPFAELGDRHDATWDGTTLRTQPREPGLKNVADLITTEQRLNPETLHRIRAQADFLDSDGTNPKGTQTVFEFEPVEEGTVLPKRILYRRPYRGGWQETEQIYDNFRKFAAISVLKP